MTRAVVRAPQPNEADAVQSVWEASFAQDDPGGRPRGGWSVAAWASDVRVLMEDGQIIGVAAVRTHDEYDRVEPAAGLVLARVALQPGKRDPARADCLLDVVAELAHRSGAGSVRLFVPGQVDWIRDAAYRANFRPVRTILHMLRPADAPRYTPPPVPELAVRSIRQGEEMNVLKVLNRAWAGTWNFLRIPLDMFLRDLEGQRDGMLLGVQKRDPDTIVATCHAVFDPADRNPDGDPRAWISNLTVDPDYRGRGVSRVMLAAGLAFLRAKGAGSITLGVDGDSPAPVRLYTSTGFIVASRLEAWDKSVTGDR